MHLYVLRVVAGAGRLRGVGELAVLSSLPSVVVVFFALVTQLADPWFVFSLLMGLYVWPRGGLTRRDAAQLLGLSLAAAALVLTLKTGIGVPRPPGSSTASIPGWLPWPLSRAFGRVAVADGFGFPSGHATGATVLYGGLAAMLEWRRRRVQALIAGLLIVGVMLSRLVLGVHFLVDVLAGVVLGTSMLWLGLRGVEPTRLFGLAAVVAVAGGGVAALQGHPGEAHDAAIGVGSAIGGAGGWMLVTHTERARSAGVRPVLGILVVGLGAVVWTSAYLFGARITERSGAEAVLTLFGSASLAAVGIALMIGLPAVLLRLKQWKQHRRETA
jgi:membrane-associated phospholipid phosphatase